MFWWPRAPAVPESHRLLIATPTPSVIFRYQRFILLTELVKVRPAAPDPLINSCTEHRLGKSKPLHDTNHEIRAGDRRTLHPMAFYGESARYKVKPDLLTLTDDARQLD